VGGTGSDVDVTRGFSLPLLATVLAVYALLAGLVLLAAA
jgi:hypothetical protein